MISPLFDAVSTLGYISRQAPFAFCYFLQSLVEGEAVQET